MSSGKKGMKILPQLRTSFLPPEPIRLLLTPAGPCPPRAVEPKHPVLEKVFPTVLTNLRGITPPQRPLLGLWVLKSFS